MGEGRTVGLAIVAVAVSLFATIAVVGIVFATGQTFGQRCEKLFPGDPPRWERCVNNLSNGVQP